MTLSLVVTNSLDKEVLDRTAVAGHLAGALMDYLQENTITFQQWKFLKFSHYVHDGNNLKIVVIYGYLGETYEVTMDYFSEGVLTTEDIPNYITIQFKLLSIRSDGLYSSMAVNVMKLLEHFPFYSSGMIFLGTFSPRPDIAASFFCDSKLRLTEV